MEYNIAFCYWGVLRSVNNTHKNHKHMIYEILKEQNISYKIFMHTWSTEDSVHYVWKNKCKQKTDYNSYKLLEPDFYKIDSQEEFLNSINMDNYFYKKTKEWNLQLLKNHLCALASLRHVYNMMESSNLKFKHVVFIRPDAYFVRSPHIEKCLSINQQTMILPNFESFEGYNDRFCMCNFKDAYVYALRLNELAEFRKNEGRIVAEKYLKYVIKNKGIIVQLNNNIKFKLIRPNNI